MLDVGDRVIVDDREDRKYLGYRSVIEKIDGDNCYLKDFKEVFRLQDLKKYSPTKKSDVNVGDVARCPRCKRDVGKYDLGLTRDIKCPNCNTNMNVRVSMGVVIESREI